MNGLDNGVIMEVLIWEIKFSVNGRILSRKSSFKYCFKKCIKNVMNTNLVNRFFLEQVPHIIKSQYNITSI